MTGRITLTLIATFLVGCHGSPAVAPTASGRHFQGSGFSMWEPGIAPRVGGYVASGGRPGTRVELSTPPGVEASAEVVVTDFVRTGNESVSAWMEDVWAARVAPGKDPTAWLKAHRPTRLRDLSGEVWQLDPFCGDCESREVFFFKDRRVVLLTFVADAPKSEMRDVARKEFQRMLKSFRWE